MMSRDFIYKTQPPNLTQIKILISILCIVLALHSFPIYSHDNNLHFERISLEQGLSQVMVYQIIQDTRGFIWVSTQDGLNKYDGYQFTVYRNNPEDISSLSDNFTRSLMEDSKGNIWVGTIGGGLNRFDPDLETFTRFQYDHNDASSISSNTIYSIYEDKKGRIWIGTAGGINRFNEDSASFTRYLNQKDNDHSVSHNSILTIVEDLDGDLWFGTEGGGLNRLKAGQNDQFIRYQNRSAGTSELSHNIVRSLLVDKQGVLWVGTESGLNVFNKNSDRFTQYKHQQNNPNSLSHNVVHAIFEDRRGSLWIGTEGGGLNRLVNHFQTEVNLSFVHYHNQIGNLRSLIDDSINSIFESSDGLIWFGTITGISKFDPNTEPMSHYRYRMNIPSSLNNNDTRSIFEDSEHTLWVGTFGGGLNKLDSKTGKFTHYKSKTNDPNTISSNYIRSIVEDSIGNLWIGTRKGLNKFNRKEGTFIRYYNVADDPNSLSNNAIRFIYVDKSDFLWIATYGGGLSLFDPRSNRFTQHKHNADIPSSLSHNKVLSIFEDSSSVIWVGTQGGGLNKLLSRDKLDQPLMFKHYQHQKDNRRSISSNTVRYLLEDSNNHIWLATQGGLNVFDKEKETFRYFREKDGLANDVIYGILEDDHKNLWISTNKGISQFNLNTESFVSYDKKDGLQDNEFNSGAFYKGYTGLLYFGGINGFNAFDPKAIKKNNVEPPVVITDFLLFNRSVKVSDKKSDSFTLKRSINSTKTIRLSYTDYIFAFEFSALNFRQSEKNQFQYKLEGLDNNWIHTDHLHRRATYTNLQDGEYRFRVKASNDDGVWNETGASIKLIIVPPFWRTQWFKLFAILTIVSLGYSIHLYRTRLLTIRTKLLRQKVKERTSELASVNKELKKLAITDSLTGLANVRKFRSFLDYEWPKLFREQGFLSIILLDIDYFKLYNDTFGHQAGDDCLKQVAIALKASVHRSADLVARYGGEEFIVLLTHTDIHGAVVVAENIRKELGSLKLIHSASLCSKYVTVSLGVACVKPSIAGNSTTLIKAADEALYLSKEKGRDRVTLSNKFHDPMTG